MKDGKVLMAGNERVDYLYSVGGRIKFGETAEAAIAGIFRNRTEKSHRRRKIFCYGRKVRPLTSLHFILIKFRRNFPKFLLTNTDNFDIMNALRACGPFFVNGDAGVVQW